jgi:hypothetical protein
MLDRMGRRISLLMASVAIASFGRGACFCLALFGCDASSTVGSEAQDDVVAKDAAPADGQVRDAAGGADIDGGRSLENDAGAADSVALTEDTSEVGPMTAPNGTCENAAEIVENAAGFGNAATVFGDLAGGEPSPVPLACSNTTGLGNILYYHANVRIGGILVAGLRRSDLGEPLPIQVVSSCTSRQCLADALGEARYSNVGTAATDVIIKVGSGMASGRLPFELQVAILPFATDAY